jgi:glycosyltransferase involved in cell wall biosynthesis
MNRVLLTVSGTVPAGLDGEIDAGARPRPDYHALAEALAADLLDHPTVCDSGTVSRLASRLVGRDLVLAVACLRRRRDYELIFTDGEQVGLPLAAMMRLFGRRRVRHAMIAHLLTARKKRWFYKLSRGGPAIDRMLVYSSRQRDLIAAELGYPRDSIVVTPFTVDCTFWDSSASLASDRPMICAAGLEFRDYPTMIEAVRGLDVDVVLAAASPWSKRRDSTAGAELPPNVEVRRLGFVELRQLYADASVVVVPLIESDFQAGITTILEAMAMGKPIVCTRSRGQTDTLVDGENALYVDPGDAGAMRDAIVRLLDDGALAERLGRAARQWARANADLPVYASRIAAELPL